MPPHTVNVHLDFIHPPSAADPPFTARLAARRARLAEKTQAAAPETAWSIRSYPVLAIHTPVMATSENTVEYPGDPMCLYAALSLAVDQAVQARQAMFAPGDPYNDLCPGWGRLPSRDYRFQADSDGIRDYTEPAPNTDQTIFAPRMWNDDIKARLAHVLESVNPRVVLISAVSPAHRYALDIARTVRQYAPGALVILGGRHIDETMRYRHETNQLALTYSNTLQAIADGRAEPVVDFLSSGDGYFVLDLLMKAISLAMDLDNKTARVSDVIEVLNQLAPVTGQIPGQATLAALDGDNVHVYPTRGRPFSLSELPPPYRAFAIRARFPIFQAANGAAQRTAHMMTVNACPYHCYYCSEGVGVVGQLIRFKGDAVQTALDRIAEYISYGAEALFFDDSVFWAGNVKLMLEFCKALAALKAQAQAGQVSEHPWLKRPDDWQRLAELQWGGQLTVENLSTLQSRPNALKLLRQMRDAGCTYIYFGIESMAESVMVKVHKNIQRPHGPAWMDKVRAALELTREAGIRAGASVLFGLDNETRATIDETIETTAQLIADGLLCIASPNILTYHPGTAISRQHGKDSNLDYHTLSHNRRPPYTFFEEAYPGVISTALSEEDIWYIYNRTQERWTPQAALPPAPGFVPTGRG